MREGGVIANAAQCATYLHALEARGCVSLPWTPHTYSHTQSHRLIILRVFLQNVKPSPSSLPPVIRGILFGLTRRKGRDGIEAKGKRDGKRGRIRGDGKEGEDKRGREKGDMKEGKEKRGRIRGGGKEGTGKRGHERGMGKRGRERGDAKEETGKRGRRIGEG